MNNLTIILNGDDLEHVQDNIVVCEVGVQHEINGSTFLKTVGTIPVPRDLYDQMDSHFLAAEEFKGGEEYLWNNELDLFL